MEKLQLAASRVYVVHAEYLGYIQTMSLTDIAWTYDPKQALPMSKRIADAISEFLRKNNLDSEPVLMYH